MCDSNLQSIDLSTAGTGKSDQPNAPSGSSPILQPVSGGRMEGSNNMAQIHRAQWEDYRSRFAPIEDKLFERFSDTTYADKATEKAGLTMANAFDSSREQTQRNLSRYGVTQTGALSEASERAAGLKKAAAVAGARNATRTALEDQKMGIMAGGLSTVSPQRSN